RPGTDGRVHVLVDMNPTDGAPLEFYLGASESRTGSHRGLLVSVARRPETETSKPAVEVSLTAALALTSPNVISLDAVYDGVAPGSWVVIQRPGKTDPDGKPSPLREVVTRVRSARVVSRADYGITGKVTELVLDTRWLDENDRLLSDIRQTTVYAR